MGSASRDRERGANLVEYVLLVALIALAVIAAVIFLRGQVESKFDETGSKLSNNGQSSQVCGAWAERDALGNVVTGLPICP